MRSRVRSMHAWRSILAPLASVALALPLSAVGAPAAPGRPAASTADWRADLHRRIQRLERETPGRFGLYVRRLDTGETYAWQADRGWYLGSSAKLPVAIAVLQEVEAGRRRLDEPLTLQEADKIDGSGDMVWQRAGSVRRLDAMLERMLMVSDNTAANMLMRTLGPQVLQQRTQALLGDGSVRITDFAQVRRAIYAEVHPEAARLANRQLVEIAGAPQGAPRLEALRRALGVPRSALRVKTMDEAYARYYARGSNTATLVAYGGMLENLVRGRLLSPPTLKRLYTDLKFDSYDAYRLEAGLPRSERFIHKTGTQRRRACHMGVINPQEGGRRAIVVATCAENVDEQRQAGALFERIGRAITATLLVPARP